MHAPAAAGAATTATRPRLRFDRMVVSLSGFVKATALAMCYPPGRAVRRKTRRLDESPVSRRNSPVSLHQAAIIACNPYCQKPRCLESCSSCPRSRLRHELGEKRAGAARVADIPIMISAGAQSGAFSRAFYAGRSAVLHTVFIATANVKDLQHALAGRREKGAGYFFRPVRASPGQAGPAAARPREHPGCFPRALRAGRRAASAPRGRAESGPSSRQSTRATILQMHRCPRPRQDDHDGQWECASARRTSSRGRARRAGPEPPAELRASILDRHEPN